MDKFKDQDSMLPAATNDKKKLTAKPGKSAQVIINPPEKVDPQRGYNEHFKQALEKHSVIIEKKTELVLQSKAQRAEFPQDVLEQVYKRGFKSLPLNTELTREQYAMNRVNSFVAGGAAMVEDCDLLPIMERMGIKGTGGAMRPHIKREKSVYNGKTVFHVVDAKGNIKHSTNDEFEAKKHLAQKYNSYMGESFLDAFKNKPQKSKAIVKSSEIRKFFSDDTPNRGEKYKFAKSDKDKDQARKVYVRSESTLSPMKRFEGTKSLVKTYKDDTPGEGKKDVAEAMSNDDKSSVALRALVAKKNLKQSDGKVKSVNFLKKMKDRVAAGKEAVKEETKKGLYYYVNKRKEAGTSRDKDSPKAPSTQDWKNAAKTAKEEFDLSELSNEVLARYKAKAGEQASAADKAGDFKKGNKRFSGIMKATNKQFDNDAKGNK